MDILLLLEKHGGLMHDVLNAENDFIHGLDRWHLRVLRVLCVVEMMNGKMNFYFNYDTDEILILDQHLPAVKADLYKKGKLLLTERICMCKWMIDVGS